MITTTAPATATRTSELKRFLTLDLLDNRYPALHGLRVFAIVSVVQFHVTWIFAGEHNIEIDLDWAASSLAVFFGMDLFFMLSGFLIGSILLHSLQTAGTQQLRRFYVRRIFRTFPSYYFVLATLVLTTKLTAAQWRHLPYEAAYLTDFLPLGETQTLMFWGWSLALEEQFYLTVPLLFFVLSRLRSDHLRVALLVALWVSALVVRLVIYYRHRPWADIDLYGALYFRPHTRYDTLVAGILLAVVHRRWGRSIARWLEAPFHRALLAIPALGCFWFLLRPMTFAAYDPQFQHVFAWGTVTTLMYFCCLLLLLHADGPLQRMLSAPIFRRIATLGYGIYLVHMPLCDRFIAPAAQALQRRQVTMLLVWPASIAAVMLLSLSVAYVLHVVIEKPSFRLRTRLAD
ncbi:MAG TPA: acyltransferase [Polyangiaceae bacterium]|nr:acyltransferase [Polyangiaceae bacterium]